MPQRPKKKATAKKKRARKAGGRGRTPPEAKSEVKGGSTNSKIIRALKRQNKELLVRVREFELDRARGQTEDDEPATGVVDVPKESQGILHIVKDLETQLDNAFAIKEALEADLADTQAKLVEETATRSELEGRVQLLEAQAALVEQLRDELSFVEEERSEVARKFKEIESQVKQITRERDTLTEQMVATDVRIADLEQVKVNLEAQVLNLEEAVADRRSLHKELEQANSARNKLMQQVKDLTGQLEATETSRKALELDLSTSKDVASGMRGELEELREKLGATETRLVEMGDQLEEQQFENGNLVESNRRLEREVKTLTAKNEVISTELETTKKALREIHNAAARTTKRIHSRYYKSSKTEKG